MPHLLDGLDADKLECGPMASDASWLTFKIEDTEFEGVEVPKLARLLDRLGAAMYAIARAQLGKDPARPGPRTAAEEALAAVRVIRVQPGSAVIELSPPGGSMQRLALDGEPSPDNVVLDLIEEIELIEQRRPTSEGRLEIRRRVREVVEEAGQIGSRAAIELRPLVPHADLPTGSVRRAEFRTRDIPVERELQRTRRSRRISGHAFMVDVEPGRQRLRLKLPDGRDMTLDVDESMLDAIREALDRVVEIEMEEEVEGATTVSKVARGLQVLPSAGPSTDRPPKTLEELEREQNLPKERPDYVSLASRVWSTSQQVAEFDEHLLQIRRAGTR